MQIVADSHEWRSGVPDRLSLLGVGVRRQRLPVGDYAIEDVALIERKTAIDLHLSLIRGRLWVQLGRLRAATVWPYLLIEGDTPYAGPLRPEAVRGLLLAISDLGIVVIRSEHADDSAEWIRQIGRRRLGDLRNVDRPPYAQRPKRDAHVPPPEKALAAARGISTTTARALLAEFGTLVNVLTASPEELRRVPGVGRRRADALHELASSH